MNRAVPLPYILLISFTLLYMALVLIEAATRAQP